MIFLKIIIAIIVLVAEIEANQKNTGRPIIEHRIANFAENQRQTQKKFIRNVDAYQNSKPVSPRSGSVQQLVGKSVANSTPLKVYRSIPKVVSRSIPYNRRSYQETRSSSNVKHFQQELGTVIHQIVSNTNKGVRSQYQTNQKFEMFGQNQNSENNIEDAIQNFLTLYGVPLETTNVNSKPQFEFTQNSFLSSLPQSSGHSQKSQQIPTVTAEKFQEISTGSHVSQAIKDNTQEKFKISINNADQSNKNDEGVNNIQISEENHHITDHKQPIILSQVTESNHAIKPVSQPGQQGYRPEILNVNSVIGQNQLLNQVPAVLRDVGNGQFASLPKNTQIRIINIGQLPGGVTSQQTINSVRNLKYKCENFGNCGNEYRNNEGNLQNSNEKSDGSKESSGISEELSIDNKQVVDVNRKRFESSAEGTRIKNKGLNIRKGGQRNNNRDERPRSNNGNLKNQRRFRNRGNKFNNKELKSNDEEIRGASVKAGNNKNSQRNQGRRVKNSQRNQGRRVKNRRNKSKNVASSFESTNGRLKSNHKIGENDRVKFQIIDLNSGKKDESFLVNEAKLQSNSREIGNIGGSFDFISTSSGNTNEKSIMNSAKVETNDRNSETNKESFGNSKEEFGSGIGNIDLRILNIGAERLSGNNERFESHDANFQKGNEEITINGPSFQGKGSKFRNSGETLGLGGSSVRSSKERLIGEGGGGVGGEQLIFSEGVVRNSDERVRVGGEGGKNEGEKFVFSEGVVRNSDERVRVGGEGGKNAGDRFVFSEGVVRNSKEKLRIGGSVVKNSGERLQLGGIVIGHSEGNKKTGGSGDRNSREKFRLRGSVVENSGGVGELVETRSKLVENRDENSEYQKEDIRHDDSGLIGKLNKDDGETIFHGNQNSRVEGNHRIESTRIPAGGHNLPNNDQYSQMPMNYAFDWSVEDLPSKNFYGQYEAKEGDRTRGGYYVQLPDSRMQRVTYTVNGNAGYKAVVSYESQAESQEKYSHISSPSK